MSDYHILTTSNDGNTMQVVAHFPVPDTDNDVSINYRVALIEALDGSQTSAVPFIQVAEQTALDAGELYEHSATFKTWPGESLLDKRDRLDVLYGTERTRVLQEIAFRLSYWGFSRDTP